MSDPKIPIMSKPSNLMELGPNGNNLATAAASRHPIDEMQRRSRGLQHPRNLQDVRRIYGPGLAMVLATEQKIARQQEEMMAGLPHAFSATGGKLYGEIVSGQDVQLDFGDFLSLPEHRPDLPQNPHKLMERQLGMM